MLTAILVTIFVLAILVGGIMTLLKSKDFKIPDDYDPSKSGYNDDEDDYTGY